jgi:hypothetical protein
VSVEGDGGDEERMVDLRKEVVMEIIIDSNKISRKYNLGKTKTCLRDLWQDSEKIFQELRWKNNILKCAVITSRFTVF